MEDIYVALKRYWGYDSFRPNQERIIQSLLSGNDTAVVMPTGGGKSLCYQLPAVVLGQTVLVVSPLIALMQDQVAQLGQMGIPAALLNSSQDGREQHAVMRDAIQGAYRLLYLSPERLVRQDTIDWLQLLPLAFFAIDEAHCISEWGHEFRPEYRQLSSLRMRFPDKPIAAFTASATRQVRHDILRQLQLRDPHKYIASFHRPNLRYVVHRCEKGMLQSRLLTAVRAYQGESVIVYAPTIAEVQGTIDFLLDRGIPAVPYHGQMENGERRRNQERWMNDEVRVLVGTIAFGLGINKPAVRAVIHTSLPKSIEQYYQEAGRAGRDGLSADCVLLWQPKDAGLLAYFVMQLSNPDEKDRAWQRYHAVRSFAESETCRHLQICNHFGQTTKWERCEMCDACGNIPEWLTVRPAEALAVTYKAIPPSAISAADPRLVQHFKDWRRRTAQAAAMPAFVVMSDATLEDLCRRRPANLDELLQVNGIGERKAELYGAEILAAFRDFREGAATLVPARDNPTKSPAEETLRLLAENKTLPEIAEIRGCRLQTVVKRVADLIEEGTLEYRMEWVGEDAHHQAKEAAEQLGTQWLKPIKEAVPPEITYEQIRLVVAYLRHSQTVALK